MCARKRYPILLQTLLSILFISSLSGCQSSEESPDVKPCTALNLMLVESQPSSTLHLITRGETTTTLRVKADQRAEQEVCLVLQIDSNYAAEAAASYGADVLPIPPEAVQLPESFRIEVGEQESEEVAVLIDGLPLRADQRYLLSLTATVTEGCGSLIEGGERVNYLFKRTEASRTMHQILFFEVNNCNPLNALAYRLKDGSYFFDAVVLFAANINYNTEEDRVYLHCNPNVQALLDQSETLLQPLRQAGIKVYLGLLGNHDAAGLAQLSPWGAQTWAQEVGEVCWRYGLDGVSLDDEYSRDPDLESRWFTTRSPEAGATLAYELKRALCEQCAWPTEVSVFEYGALQQLPEVLADGVFHPQSEFLDILIPNYGAVSIPYGDLTYAHCAGASLELNYSDTLSESYARDILEMGFGWCMWFGFDPAGSGGVKSNLEHAMSQFRTAARIFYQQELRNPEHLYLKTGEGIYDPAPSPIGGQ